MSTAYEMYYNFRVIPTGLITIKGIIAYLDKERWPSQKIKDLRTLWLGYILSDGVILAMMGKMDVPMMIHHGLFTVTGLLCYERMSDEDHPVIAEMLPASCVCESMGFLACLNVVTKRKYSNLINFMHLLNIFYIRRPLWRGVQILKVKNNIIRTYLNIVVNSICVLDLFWAFSIVKTLMKKKPLSYSNDRLRFSD